MDNAWCWDWESWRVWYSRCVMEVSARRSRPLQPTWLDGCGRLPGPQWKTSCIGCRLNTGLQWLRAAPGRATRYETNDWRSAIDILGERRGSTGKGNSAVVALGASFVGRMHGNAIVGTIQKRIRTSSRRLCSLWTSISHSNQYYPSICPSLGVTLRLSHTMVSADLNFIQFYQPPTKAGLPREKVPKASNAIAPTVLREGKPPKAPRPSSGWNGGLWSDDPIEFINMIDSPPTEHLSPFHEPAPDLKDTEADAGGKDFSRSLTNSP